MGSYWLENRPRLLVFVSLQNVSGIFDKGWLHTGKTCKMGCHWIFFEKKEFEMDENNYFKEP